MIPINSPGWQAVLEGTGRNEKYYIIDKTISFWMVD